jgi:MFS superfamily sulfate permease-like transporter
MLEIVKQIESGEKTSFIKAFKTTISVIIQIIPLAIIWAIIWLILLIIKSFTKEKSKNKKEFNAENAAKTLAGYDNPFSWWRLGLEMLEKLLRMWIFLALPAIAWENKNAFQAIAHSTEIIRKHPLQFLTAYTLTGATALIMALPLIPIYVLDKMDYIFPSYIWIIVIIYECIIWTLGVYLEQMSVGILYLWHIKWERKGGKGDLSSVKKPDLLDNVYELK